MRAYRGGRAKGGPPGPDDEAEMREASIEGVKALQALAAAVRSEQDFCLVPRGGEPVGALKKENATPAAADRRLRSSPTP